jgi:hypothetical protein
VALGQPGNLLVIGFEREGVQGERRRLILDFERVLLDSHTDFFPGEPIFAKEAPVAEADVAMLVQLTGKLRGIQQPREDLFRVGVPQHAAQHLHLRAQKAPQAKIQIPPQGQASSASKDTMIAALQKRVREQAAEIEQLKQQVEVAYGLLATQMKES